MVAGPAISSLRQELPAKFRARFGVPVEYISGRDATLRVRTEQSAGIYTIDVFLLGTGTISTVLYPEKMLDPIKPTLVLPEVLDPSRWKGEKLPFVDPEGQYVLRLLTKLRSLFSVNTRYVNSKEFQFAKDLLNPNWKGKISVYDPTASGPGDAIRFYLQLGEEFVKKLYIDQNSGWSSDQRQLADWLARGTYPVSIGNEDEYLEELQRDGFPIVNVYELRDLVAEVRSGQGNVALARNAPHPNAARVFINWLAAKEGLETFARGSLYAKTRKGIDEASFLPPEFIPRPGVNYFDASDWDFTVITRAKVRSRLREILRR